MTMGDLIDRTPKELISKVMLEEKLFETWFGGRVVLLGDGMSLLQLIRVSFKTFLLVLICSFYMGDDLLAQ